MEEYLVIELAKNNKYTCKYFDGQSYKYLYSKYVPEKVEFDVNINPDTDYFIFLGLGLGYELDILRSKSNKKIYVIENNIEFYNHYIKNNTVEDNIQILLGDQFKHKNFQGNFQFIVNENLLVLNKEFFKNVVNYFKKDSQRKKILFLNHPTIANDCIVSLKKKDYFIKKIEFMSKKHIIEEMMKDNYEYIFTINFYDFIADICEEIGLKYISWVVDTPCYTLYTNPLNYKYSFVFIYDESIVQDLLKKGAENIFYLPVAADVNRLDSVILTAEEKKKYSADVAFLGSCCSNNEYKNIFSPILSHEVKEIVDKVIQIQLSTNHFIIKDLIDKDFLDIFTSNGYIKLTNNKYNKIDDKEILALYLGRYHSYIERKQIIKALANRFDLALYGEKGWLKEENDGVIHKVYKGEAEHYFVMPKIFKASKINLNNTRCFVESGLPMRVFDVLGSNGFLITNNKEDINRLFTVGKDLVVYRDLKDMNEIIEYYLKHDKERLLIAQNGYETVRKYHTFDQRIKNIIDIVTKLSTIKN